MNDKPNMGPHRPGPAIILAIIMATGLVASVRELAHADPALRIKVTGSLPFSEDELRRAVLARRVGQPAAEQGQVLVAAGADGAMYVTVGDKTQRVEIGDRTGAEAARVVALVVTSLLLPEAAPTLPPLAPPPAAVDTVALVPPSSDRHDHVVRPATPPISLRVAVAPTVSSGLGGNDARLFGATLGMTGSFDLWRAGISLGVLWTRPPSPNVVHVSMRAWPVRVVVGRKWYGVEWLGAVVAVPFGLGDAVERGDVMVGGGLLVRTGMSVGAGFELYGVAGADVFQKRLTIGIGGTTIFSTPRVNAHLALGVSWSMR